MKANSEKYDDPKFRKQIVKDLILLLIISMVSAIGIVVVTLAGIKYDW